MQEILVAQPVLHSECVQCSRFVFDLDVVDGLRNAILRIFHGIAVHLCQVQLNEIISLLVSRFLLNLYFIIRRYPNAAKVLYCSLFGIFAALVLVVATFDKFTPAYDVMHDLGYDLYVSPFTRVLPYLIGVGAGYVMFNSNGEMPFQEVCFSSN